MRLDGKKKPKQIKWKEELLSFRQTDLACLNRQRIWPAGTTVAFGSDSTSSEPPMADLCKSIGEQYFFFRLSLAELRWWIYFSESFVKQMPTSPSWGLFIWWRDGMDNSFGYENPVRISRPVRGRFPTGSSFCKTPVPSFRVRIGEKLTFLPSNPKWTGRKVCLTFFFRM